VSLLADSVARRCKPPQQTSTQLTSSDPTVKQFIRNVRAAKTIADERAVIQKESASIRASFREESADHGVRYT
jgi:hypothetical protein